MDAGPVARAPAAAAQTVVKRRIVEFCCGSNSLIGRLAPPDCEVIRLTLEDDVLSAAGFAKALHAVSDNSIPALLFGSLPCTGGSPYQYLNWWRGAKTRRKIRAHWRTFQVLWNAFQDVANTCLNSGGEWPGSGLGHACIGAAGRSRHHSIDGAANLMLSMGACTAWLAKQYAPRVHHCASRGRSRALARRSTGYAEPATVHTSMYLRLASTRASQNNTHHNSP